MPGVGFSRRRVGRGQVPPGDVGQAPPVDWEP